MIWWIIAAIIYIAGIFISYKTVISKWTKQSTFNKIWFSIFWIVLIHLYGIHILYNRLKGN